MEEAKLLGQIISDMERGRGGCISLPCISLSQKEIPAHQGNGSDLCSLLGEVPWKVSQGSWLEDGLDLLGASAGVSAGGTFPTPGLDAVYQPSSYHSGPPTDNTQDSEDKKSLEEAKLLGQMLSDLERRPGEVPRKASRGAWLEDGLDLLGASAGVSAEGTFPAPGLDGVYKPSSYHNGPPTDNTQDSEDKKSLEEAKLLGQMLSDLERRPEMEGETVLKNEFPRGSRGSLAASAAGREAMPGTVTGGEVPRKASRGAWLEDGLDLLGASAGVSAEGTFPAPGLDGVYKPSSYHNGPPTDNTQDSEDKKSLEEAKLLGQMLSDLERRPEMEGETVLKNEFPRGSRGSLAASAAGREAMPGTVTGGEVPRKASRGAWLEDGLDLLGASAGPPTDNTQDSEDKKSLEEAKLLGQMLSDLERRPEMEGETVLKNEFPRGSRGSLAASAAGREAIPSTVTGGEVPRKASRGAWLEDGLDLLGASAGEVPWKASQGSWLEDGLDLLGASAGVSAGGTFPAPGLDAVYKPSSYHSGPPTGNAQYRRDKKSLEAAKLLDQMLSDLERRRGECISLSLHLTLTSRGLAFHIWTHRDWHSRRGSMAPSLSHCCCHTLQCCFPARSGCSFSSASAEEGIWHQLTGSPNCPTGHAHPEIP
ncbi:uncharacterized protein LOC117002496 isoform X2 [Catharus ustulatus]|uniref:uncharacterized protein LOC117002496 isoform X2 n=1 Tax=Catharus ustulatus TaxID=91951 RepID=UPI00140E0710|nr:uncharacterized protein LOC117002496 isoform X2 [Catharus ustulatus]